MRQVLPLFIGLLLAITLYKTVGWWGFLVIFPWIGLSISIGIYITKISPPPQKQRGRRITLLLILPVLLFFIPIVNNENLQLEGIILLLSIGFFSKGVIHYAIAKVFGPMLWGRGFCGWACWTAAILDWLPINRKGPIPSHFRNLRYVALAFTILIPVALITFQNYDIRQQYINKAELVWMLTGNAIYYILAIPLAFYFSDRRAFCKIACPISLIMKIPTSISLNSIKPSGKQCIECSKCSRNCPMDIDVMEYIKTGSRVRDTECILCQSCKQHCPVGAIQ